VSHSLTVSRRDRRPVSRCLQGKCLSEAILQAGLRASLTGIRRFFYRCLLHSFMFSYARAKSRIFPGYRIAARTIQPDRVFRVNALSYSGAMKRRRITIGGLRRGGGGGGGRKDRLPKTVETPTPDRERPAMRNLFGLRSGSVFIGGERLEARSRRWCSKDFSDGSVDQVTNDHRPSLSLSQRLNRRVGSLLQLRPSGTRSRWSDPDPKDVRREFPRHLRFTFSD